MSEASTSGKPLEVVIAGGGITGLATAFRLLERAGDRVRVTVLEADERLGGKIHTERRDGLVFDGGPDAFVTTKPHATQLCRDVGIGDRLLETMPENRRVYVHQRGKTFHLPEGLLLAVPTRFWPLVKSPLFSWPGLARMGLDLVLPPMKGDEDESISSFLGRRLGQEAVDRLGDPLLGGIYAGDPSKLSIRSTFPQLLELEQKHGSLVRGAMAMRARAPKRTGPPPSPFHSLRGGMATLPEAVADRVRALGGTIRTRTRIEAIARTEGGAFRVSTTGPGGAAELLADELVLTTPARVSAELLRPISGRAAEELASIAYVSTATCLMAFPRSAVPHPLDAVGVLFPKTPDRRALALTFVTSKWEGRAPEGTVVMRVFLGGYAQGQVAHLPDDELVAIAREELRELLGITEPPTTYTIFRWLDASPQPWVGHEAKMARMREAVAEVPGLSVAGAVIDGVGIPDCARQAQSVASSILAKLV